MDSWDASLTGVVLLPTGHRVRGRALRGAVLTDDAIPAFGLYLTAKPHREQGWESQWVCWPDFRLPRSPLVAIAAIENAYERSGRMKVEIACAGGNGRTGTAIALLARYAGVPAEDAVAWVRANYRARAVETPRQKRFARSADLAR